MRGPDKHLEETPRLNAAIEELRYRFGLLVRLDPLASTGFLSIDTGVLICRSSVTCPNRVKVFGQDWWVDVGTRRAYTDLQGEPTFTNPQLLFGVVLPAVRQYMLLDDIVRATED